MKYCGTRETGVTIVVKLITLCRQWPIVILAFEPSSLCNKAEAIHIFFLNVQQEPYMQYKDLLLPPPSAIILLLILTIILKPLLQISTQPPIAPQAFHPATSNLPLLIPIIKSNHTLTLFVAKQLSIHILPAVNNSPRRPRKPGDPIRKAVAQSRRSRGDGV